MTTVDQVLTRARSALNRGTLYWLGAGGRDPQAPTPSSSVAVATAWADSTHEKRAELAPLAAAMGIDLHDPHLTLDACDCSGFVCWALGFSRKAPAKAPYTADDGSIYTDSIWHDAKGAGVRFMSMAAARPGGLIVYPSGNGERYGHVAIIVQADAQGRATQVIDCSKANVLAAPHNAIKLTKPVQFESNPQSIYVWCRDVG